MLWHEWALVACALFGAGWFVTDGIVALVSGDYVTPRSGQYAGQLGPWAKVASAVGIDPRSTTMKLIFVVYGLLWLAVIAGFIMKADWSWWAMLLGALFSLWYLPFGTLLGVVQIVLLFIGRSGRV